MAPPTDPGLPVILFGYNSSPLTIKIKLALKLKGVPYLYHPVPSMLPRPIITDSLGVPYRKIPILAVGREIYCDSALVLEALEHFFPPSEGWGTVYPATGDGRRYRGLVRGLASFWTDRPLFRVTTGLVPGRVWRTRFGEDRSQLIGHKLNADKLERKLPENLAGLDAQLSWLEGIFEDGEEGGTWILETQRPGLADISVYYQLWWGREIASGRMVGELSGGGAESTNDEGMDGVFNSTRYPKVWRWFKRTERYFDDLREVEEEVKEEDAVLKRMREAPALGKKSLLLPTPAADTKELSEKTGVKEGVEVSVAPDDTGRDYLSIGTLTAISPEQIVIKPTKSEKLAVDVRIHFPRIGFVVKPVSGSKL